MNDQNDSNNPQGLIESIAPAESKADLERIAREAEQRLSALGEKAPATERASARLDLSEALLGLGRNQDAWVQARIAFDDFMSAQLWQQAAEACDLLFRCEQTDSIAALAHGVWLGVSFPIDPQISVTLLHHIVDETPDDSDGGAVAAVAAHYIADLRAKGDQHTSLTFLTVQILGQVAKRHRNITDQQGLDIWMEMLGLNNPDEFLPKLATMLDAMVDGHWWFDRDALRARLPQH